MSFRAKPGTPPHKIQGPWSSRPPKTSNLPPAAPPSFPASLRFQTHALPCSRNYSHLAKHTALRIQGESLPQQTVPLRLAGIAVLVIAKQIHHLPVGPDIGYFDTIRLYTAGVMPNLIRHPGPLRRPSLVGCVFKRTRYCPPAIILAMKPSSPHLPQRKTGWLPRIISIIPPSAPQAQMITLLDSHTPGHAVQAVTQQDPQPQHPPQISHQSRPCLLHGLPTPHQTGTRPLRSVKTTLRRRPLPR